jgi:hypothetical protein
MNHVEEILRQFDQVYEDTSFIEAYGLECTISLATLVGYLKDNRGAVEATLAKRKLRDTESYLHSKAEDWQDAYLQGQRDRSAYEVIRDLLSINGWESNFIIGCDDADEPYTLVTALLYILAEHLTYHEPVQTFEIYVATLSTKEYEESTLSNFVEILLGFVQESI